MATNAPVAQRPRSPKEVAARAPDHPNKALEGGVQTRSNWRETARRMWLWPVMILISLPIAGYIADVVINGVDSVGTALAGGVIAGAIIGAAGWFVLRKLVSWLWIPATTVGMAVGLAGGAALVDYGIDRGDLLLMGAGLAWASEYCRRSCSHDTRSPARSGGPLLTHPPGRSAGS